MKYIPMIPLIIIVCFVNLNETNPLWDLLYYMQYYIFVIFFIIILWQFSNLLTRSILIALGFYYGFELSMDILKIINQDLVDQIYTTKTINYILSITCGLSLLILPLINRIKKINNERIINK